MLLDGRYDISGYLLRESYKVTLTFQSVVMVAVLMQVEAVESQLLLACCCV